MHRRRPTCLGQGSAPRHWPERNPRRGAMHALRGHPSAATRAAVCRIGCANRGVGAHMPLEVEPMPRLKHGHHRRSATTPEYRAWCLMIMRCTNPATKSFKHYGARGVSICSRWRQFENFFADMGRKPSPTHSLDRINNNGDYEPSNCRWATSRQQQANRRSNRPITAFGETMNMQDWCRRIGINQATFWCRLDRGWSAERAVSEPVQVQYSR